MERCKAHVRSALTWLDLIGEGGSEAAICLSQALAAMERRSGDGPDPGELASLEQKLWPRRCTP